VSIPAAEKNGIMEQVPQSFGRGSKPQFAATGH
jgi:hypothetical protein